MTDNQTCVARVEAAGLLGLSKHGVDGLIKRGELRVARPGVRRRPSLSRDEVLALQAARNQRAGARAEAERAEKRRRTERQDPLGPGCLHQRWPTARTVSWPPKSYLWREGDDAYPGEEPVCSEHGDEFDENCAECQNGEVGPARIEPAEWRWHVIVEVWESEEGSDTLTEVSSERQDILVGYVDPRRVDYRG